MSTRLLQRWLVWMLGMALGDPSLRAQSMDPGIIDDPNAFEIVESGEGRFERGPQGTTKTLSGGVVLKHRGMILRCNQVVLSGSDRIAKAEGKVKLNG
ncbi:MAG: hypothetical protein FJ350_02565, partial [Sphingomonadales bacterium]|nr:hypothetical protein [Sphingomonadales bacterium]